MAFFSQGKGNSMRPAHTRVKGVSIARKLLTKDQLDRLRVLIDRHVKEAIEISRNPANVTPSLVTKSKLDRFLKSLQGRAVCDLISSEQQSFNPEDNMTLASNLKKLPEIVYLYNEIGCTGPQGLPPLIAIKRGEMGYYPVYENKSAYELNKNLRITYQQSSAMLNGAMKGWHLVGADPDHSSNAIPKFFRVSIIKEVDNSETHTYFNKLDHAFMAIDVLRNLNVAYEAQKLNILPKGVEVKTFEQFVSTVPGYVPPAPPAPPVPSGPGPLVLADGRKVYSTSGGGTASYPAGDPGPEA